MQSFHLLEFFWSLREIISCSLHAIIYFLISISDKEGNYTAAFWKCNSFIIPFLIDFQDLIYNCNIYLYKPWLDFKGAFKLCKSMNPCIESVS